MAIDGDCVEVLALAAFVLVSGTGGGGTIALADGTWVLWLRVTHSPERPVRKVDTLIVT